MRIFKVACGVLCLGTLVSCGGGGGSGTPPTPTLSSVTVVSPGGTLFLGQSYTFTMQARMSDGSTVSAGGTWGSDAAPVATVNSSTGVVQIVGLGAATIYVDYQGQRGSVLIRSTVRYEGTLNSIMRVTRCTQTGRWATDKACTDPDLARVGDEFLALGTFTQTDTTVTAVMDLGDSIGDFPSAPVVATVGGGGELVFDTIHQDSGLTVRTRWSFRPLGLNQVEGTAVLRWTVNGISGFLEHETSIRPSSITRPFESIAGSGVRSLSETFRRYR